MKIFFLVILSLLYSTFSNSVLAQKKQDVFFVDTLSIEFVNNKIFVPVFINNIERRFLFDTGAILSLSQPLQIEHDYELKYNENVMDINGNVDSIPFVLIREFSMGKMNFENKVSAVLNLDSMLLHCLNIDGIIGSNILNELIIKIDIQKKMLIFSNQKNIFKKEKGYTLPLKTLNNNIPIITNLSPFKKAKEEVLFDTGDKHFYSISNRAYHFFDEKIGLSNYTLETALGSSSIGLYGMERDTLKYKIKTDHFRLKNFTFRNVIIKNTSDTNSRLGADILNYGYVILDYINDKFTFIPYNNSKSILLKDETEDIYISVVNDEFIISLIWEKSELYKVGLRKGFIIKKVNDIDVDKENLCETFLNIRQELVKNQLTVVAVDSDGIERIYRTNK
jgi:hypothetical protein